MTLNVTPNPLVKGGQATVCIDGGPPNTAATVDIDDGGHLSDTLVIALDAAGQGCANWSVPVSWNTAKFNYGDEEVVRHVVAPPVVE